MLWQILYALLVLVLLVPCIIALAYVLKKCMQGPLHKDSGFKILRQYSLGQKERIVILEVEDVKLIVGISPNAFNTLHVLEKNV